MRTKKTISISTALFKIFSNALVFTEPPPQFFCPIEHLIQSFIFTWRTL